MILTYFVIELQPLKHILLPLANFNAIFGLPWLLYSSEGLRFPNAVNGHPDFSQTMTAVSVATAISSASKLDGKLHCDCVGVTIAVLKWWMTLMIRKSWKSREENRVCVDQVHIFVIRHGDYHR